MSWKDKFPKENRYFETDRGILYNAEAIETMSKFPERIFDAIITDPPYGTTACKWDTVIPFEDMWRELKKIRKDRIFTVLFGSEPFSSLLRVSNLKEYKYDWIWVKNNASNFQLVNYQPLKVHENISVFCNNSPAREFADIMQYYMKKLKLTQFDIAKLQPSRNGKITGWVSNKLSGKQLPTKEQWGKICGLFGIENNYDEIIEKIKKPTFNTNTQKTSRLCKNKNKAGRLGHINSEKKRDVYIQNNTGYPKSVLFFKRESNYHPTQKPLGLLEYLVKTYTNEGDLVLDFTCGSSTTLLACEKLNRRWIGIEIEEKYCEISKQRILKEL